MFYRIVNILGICLFLSIESRCQSFDSLLERYNNLVPKEKVHIHFDNCVYSPGQTIWYKAYLLNEAEPSDLSKNFYIDWFDEKGKLVERIIAPVIGSCASGNFMVPEGYTGKLLQVLAYTKWMLNFDSAFLFHKIIPIAQSATLQNNRPVIVPGTTLQFFPEGGDLIENITSTIAFKTMNTAGLPVAANGTIYNKNGQAVTRFNTVHDGMGTIKLIHLPGEAYRAEWKDPLGNTQYTSLPLAKTTGIVLSISHESGGWAFTIERSATKEDRFKKISIVAAMDQQIVFRAVANFTEKEKITAQLPTSNFPSGVLQLTVFDINQQPVAERIFFVNNEEYLLKAEVHFDTLNLGKRGKNVYEIDVPDSISTSLSLAITDGESVNDSTGNIISQFLLSDEIKGYIHNPAYYFSSTEDSVVKHLDLVMLTNGWRRFKWEDVLRSKIPALPYQRDTSYLSINGEIEKLSDSKIKKAEFVNLILVGKDSSTQFIFAPLKADGSFGQDNLILFDTTKVFYQLNKTYLPGRKTVTINNNFLPFDSTRQLRYLTTFLSDTSGLARIKSIAEEQKRVNTLMKQTTLKEVVVHAKIKSRIDELNDKYSSGLFSGRDDYKFNVIDDQFIGAYLNVFTYLQGKLPGLTVRNAFSDPSATWRGGRESTYFLDEMQVDASALASISINYVAYIKVVRSGFNPGAIAVYTKKGDDAKTINRGLDFILIPGYSPVKQFYSPNYGEQQNNFVQTDLRRTLYWKPNIQTGAVNKKVTISFYNNDISHTLQLVLEGLAQDGRMIHFSKLLK